MDRHDLRGRHWLYSHHCYYHYGQTRPQGQTLAVFTSLLLSLWTDTTSGADTGCIHITATITMDRHDLRGRHWLYSHHCYYHYGQTRPQGQTLAVFTSLLLSLWTDTTSGADTGCIHITATITMDRHDLRGRHWLYSHHCYYHYGQTRPQGQTLAVFTSLLLSLWTDTTSGADTGCIHITATITMDRHDLRGRHWLCSILGPGALRSVYLVMANSLLYRALRSVYQVICTQMFLTTEFRFEQRTNSRVESLRWFGTGFDNITNVEHRLCSSLVGNTTVPQDVYLDQQPISCRLTHQEILNVYYLLALQTLTHLYSNKPDAGSSVKVRSWRGLDAKRKTPDDAEDTGMGLTTRPRP
uniref:Uncharacterized protein n=1 Tax=Timema monikensis TaxID=170555 RepID=A0A7R9EFG0_9NEOP|nr:unnamed protein product [Timema monikensis]